MYDIRSKERREIARVRASDHCCARCIQQLSVSTVLSVSCCISVSAVSPSLAAIFSIMSYSTFATSTWIFILESPRLLTWFRNKSVCEKRLASLPIFTNRYNHSRNKQKREEKRLFVCYNDFTAWQCRNEFPSFFHVA